ncbi:MAG TPA: TauD/TfdA family dioxygenase [Patescibacteria group bacterium]|nr:TauD/TfdA family dioxygenase [Patescibacteria group bacterium]
MKILKPNTVNLQDKNAGEKILNSLNEFGFVVFSPMKTPDELLNLVGLFGKPILHRDSDKRGITIVAPKETTIKESNLGFTNSELIPHTDGTGVADPADLLALYCETPSTSGGESFMIDGKKIYDYMAANKLDMLKLLSTPESAVFGNPKNNPFIGTIFNKSTEDEHITLRFRGDMWGFYAGPISRILEQFMKILNDFKITFQLSKNEGYIVNNKRILHGRRDFKGYREMQRVLVTIDKSTQYGSQLQKGFIPQSEIQNK